MAKFMIMGCYTAKGLGGFINNPDTDWKVATTALYEAAGAKLTGYADLRKKYDFMVEVSSGAVTDFSIHEVINLNVVAKIANKMASEYKELGK